MKALAWHGRGDIRCDDVADPKIEHPRDAIINACAICGSDLHIYGGIIPAMKKGDVLGHVVEMPPAVGFGPTFAQVLGNYWLEFENPPTDRFIADGQSALSQEILDVP